MISLRHISKSYPGKEGQRLVLNDLTCDFPPGNNIGILGARGAGKSTLLDVIRGSLQPDAGEIRRNGSVSWPLGSLGVFSSKLTGRQNLRFLCRLYGADYADSCAFVSDFTELEELFDKPFSSYPGGMKWRLACGISLALNFDYYILDDRGMSVDADFKKKYELSLEQLKKSSAIIMAAGNMRALEAYCDKYLVLHEGKLIALPSYVETIKFFAYVCSGPK